MPEDLGTTDLDIAGLRIWVHGRQFPNSSDYYDGNWLRVTAHCAASGAHVWTQGALFSVSDVARFGDKCAAMLRGDSMAAALDPLERELKVLLEAADRLGHIRAIVDITPDPLAQAHRFEFEVDQSFLPGIIRQCATLVQEYPIRGQ